MENQWQQDNNLVEVYALARVGQHAQTTESVTERRADEICLVAGLLCDTLAPTPRVDKTDRGENSPAAAPTETLVETVSDERSTLASPMPVTEIVPDAMPMVVSGQWTSSK